MKPKINIAYIVENEEDTLPLSLNSVLNDADKVIIIYSMSHDKTSGVLYDYNKKYPNKIKIILDDYPHEEKGANGKQRNKYLEYLKKHHMDEYCLVLDADEVCEANWREELEKEIKDGIDIASIKMRHTQYNLAWEDATQQYHYVLHRFFKITDDLKYPEIEHPTLMREGRMNLKNINSFTIWHLGYSREMFNILKKYKNHLAKSNIHTPQYLQWWLKVHLFGKYPMKEFSPTELPQVIKDYFCVPDLDDEIYFQERMNLETKHLIDAWHWRLEFTPFNVIEIGCGVGARLLACQMYGMQVDGIEKSKWAVDNTPFKNIQSKLQQGDITDASQPDILADLVVCYDLLEHLPYDKLDLALKNIYNYGTKNYLFSIPFKNDPNLYKDKTHIIKEDKEWWISKLEEHNFKIKPTPEHFLFKEQLVVCEK